MPRKKNLFGKSADRRNPHAIFESDHLNFEWRVLKTWKHADNETSDQYARWFCFVTSDMCPEGEYGDVYKKEIVENARLTEASPEWLQAYNVKLSDDKKSWFDSHVEVIGLDAKEKKLLKEAMLLHGKQRYGSGFDLD
tara:strand:- start:18 stop:431 length:414 start_codon:yes stop_codon:yes gene_type:complete